MQKQRIKAKVADLILNEGQLDWLPENPRQWTREDLELTKASLLRDPDFQEDNPLKVVALPDGKLLVFAGNLRTSAAREVRWKTFEAMLYTPEGPEDEETIRRRALLDNGSFGSWDYDRLADKWSDMPFKELGIKVWDTPQEETPGPAQAQEDDFDETADAVETRCKTGDIWQLGNHRLMCGDSTDPASVALLMNGEKGKMLFTSPPYSDMREYRGGKELSVGKIIQFIPTYRPFTDYQCVNLGIQRKDHDIFEYWNDYIKAARDCGYKMLAWNVWDKTKCGSIGNQSAFFPIRHEWIFVFGTEFYEINTTWEKSEESIYNGAKPRRVRQADGTMKTSGTGDLSNPLKQMESVIQVLPEQGEIIKEHPATFPVYLPAEYIKAMTNAGDSIIEPFAGAGTTLIAAEQLGRRCYAMELDTHFCDVILARWEKLTGQTAHKID